MNKQAEILRKLKMLTNSDFITPATVKTVDTDTNMCDVVDIDGNEIVDVKLSSREGTADFLIVPKTESACIIARELASESDYVIVNCSEIEEIVFLNGENGGIPKAKEIKANDESIKAYCEGMKDQIYAALNAVGVGTAANGPGAATAFDTAMNAYRIELSESLENDKIKH